MLTIRSTLVCILFLALISNVTCFLGSDKYCTECLKIAPALQDNSTMTAIESKLNSTLCVLLPESQQEQCYQNIHNIILEIEEVDKYFLNWYTPQEFCSILSFCQTYCCSTARDPQEVHISLSTPNTMNVMWVTQLQSDNPTAYYGLSPDNMNETAIGTSRTYQWGGWNGFIYLVNLPALKPSTKYYYIVGDPSWKMSFTPFSFITPPAVPIPAEQSIKFITYGDMGSSNAADPNLYWLVQAAHNHNANAVLHIGDISYADAYQPVWDTFMQKIEPVAAQIPYMTTPGNHEKYFNFAAYRYRFEMPTPLPNIEHVSRDNVTLYYSFDYGNSHVISLSLEMNDGKGTDLLPGNAQYNWLQEDLQGIDRTLYPWVIVFLHRPLYCTTNKTDRCVTDAAEYRSMIEDLLYEYRVTLVLSAHNHNYERTLPVYNSTISANVDANTEIFVNPKAPIYAVVGTGGNHEGVYGDFMQTVPSWSVKQSQHAEWGYVLIDATASELQWKFFGAQDHEVIDSFTIQIEQ